MNTFFQRYLTRVLFVLLVASVVFGSYTYWKLNKLRQNPQQIAQEEVKDLVAKVKKLIVLPADEMPTVATVNKPDALKDQTFFANAKIGYKVLIYTAAKKAILFDPTSGKIVEVAPINIGDKTKVAPNAKP